jgi:hypothetical protein
MNPYFAQMSAQIAAGCRSDGAVEPCGALPRKCLFTRRVLWIERGKRRDRLYKNICRLKTHIPEPKNEEDRCSIGREYPEEKLSTTAEGLEKLKRRKAIKREELNLAFNLNWDVTELNIV